ncbi:hypothetical protein I5654_11935 [Hafnia paralvei]|uniref:hypothetical protein n=1 Tax=Hafnia paralvei TaxID=546367 RepID=UPI001C050809|nr:hypothetical protein [Hafnia paralvei]MBU2673374.1 hypothetical protein [Hafnia paralvei]
MTKISFQLAPVWDAVMSVYDIDMLVKHTESSITAAINDVKKTGAVSCDIVECDYDEEHSYYHETYYYLSTTGDSEQEVIDEYSHLISQMYRRSTFMNIFGLFEYRMNRCRELMIDISKQSEHKSISKQGVLQKTHWMLSKIINYNVDKVVNDVDYLRVIRNYITHNNGHLPDFHKVQKKQNRKTQKEKMMLKSVKKATDAGVLQVNQFNDVILNEDFLPFVVNEFSRYSNEMKESIIAYNRRMESA